MPKLSLIAGTVSKTVKIFVQDSSVTTGAGLTGLVFNTSSLTAYYTREGTSGATAISLVTATQGTWTSSGFIVVDGTNMPGVYEVGLPNAALAAGAKSVVVMLKGAANMAPVVLEIELTAVDNQDGVRFALTALPNAAANAAGGLLISTAGALDMDDLAADVDATETRVVLALPAAAPQAAGGLITSTAGSLDMDDLAADVDATETRVVLALPAVAPNGAGGLLITAAGSLDMDEAVADIDEIVAFGAPPSAATNASTLLAATVAQTDVSALTTSTVNQALQAARAQGAGAWSISGVTLTLLNPNGSTFRTFTLDSSSAPTQRA